MHYAFAKRKKNYSRCGEGGTQSPMEPDRVVAGAASMNHEPRIRTRTRATTATLAVVALAAAGCGGGNDERDDPVKRGGPLVGVFLSAGDGSSEVGVSQEQGREMMFGSTQVVNDGKQPATIDRIGLIGLSKQLQLTHTYAAGPERRETVATQVDWSASQLYPRLNDAAGYVIEPGGRERSESTQLLFILRGTAPGKHVSEKVAIDYHVGDQRYRREIGDGFAACIVPKGDPIKCPGDREARTPKPPAKPAPQDN